MLNEIKVVFPFYRSLLIPISPIMRLLGAVKKVPITLDSLNI